MSHKTSIIKLTRISIELSEYDFDILYKVGPSNINADALPVISIDSHILKEMIPISKEEEPERIKKALMITRSKSARENANDEQLNMWECK